MDFKPEVKIPVEDPRDVSTFLHFHAVLGKIFGSNGTGFMRQILQTQRSEIVIKGDTVADPGFPRRGGRHQSLRSWRKYLFGEILVENWMKMKEIGPGGAFCMLQVPFAFKFLSLNNQMAICWQKQSLIYRSVISEKSVKWQGLFGYLTNFVQIWRMVIRWLFCCGIAIWPFRLKLKQNLRYFENTPGVLEVKIPVEDPRDVSTFLHFHAVLGKIFGSNGLARITPPPPTPGGNWKKKSGSATGYSVCVKHFVDHNFLP